MENWLEDRDEGDYMSMSMSVRSQVEKKPSKMPIITQKVEMHECKYIQCKQIMQPREKINLDHLSLWCTHPDWEKATIAEQCQWNYYTIHSSENGSGFYGKQVSSERLTSLFVSELIDMINKAITSSSKRGKLSAADLISGLTPSFTATPLVPIGNQRNNAPNSCYVSEIVKYSTDNKFKSLCKNLPERFPSIPLDVHMDIFKGLCKHYDVDIPPGSRRLEICQALSKGLNSRNE